MDIAVYAEYFFFFFTRTEIVTVPLLHRVPKNTTFLYFRITLSNVNLFE